MPYPQWVQEALPQYEITKARFSDLLNAGQAWAKSGVSPEELPTTLKDAHDRSQGIYRASVQRCLELPSVASLLDTICGSQRFKVSEVVEGAHLRDWKGESPLTVGTTAEGHQILLQLRSPKPGSSWYPHQFDHTQFGLGVRPHPDRFPGRHRDPRSCGQSFLATKADERADSKTFPTVQEEDSSKSKQEWKNTVSSWLSHPALETVVKDFCGSRLDHSETLETVRLSEGPEGLKDTLIKLGKTKGDHGLFLRAHVPYSTHTPKLAPEAGDIELGLELVPNTDRLHTLPEPAAQSAYSGTTST